MSNSIEKYYVINIKDNSPILKFKVSDFNDLAEARMTVLTAVDNLVYSYMNARYLNVQIEELYKELKTVSDEHVIQTRSDIPLYFINLIMAHFNLKIIELRKSSKLEEAVKEQTKE